MCTIFDKPKSCQSRLKYSYQKNILLLTHYPDFISSLISYSYSDRHPGAFDPSRSQSHARSVPIRHLEPCMASISRRAKNNYPKQENERVREKIVLSWPKKAIRLPNVSHVFYHRSRHHSSQPDIASSSSPLKGNTRKIIDFLPEFLCPTSDLIFRSPRKHFYGPSSNHLCHHLP